MAKRKLKHPDIKMDLTPMIDVIFLLIIFFLLAGRITDDLTNNQITVPPTKTAEKWEKPDDWKSVRIEVWGDTQQKEEGHKPGHVIKIGGKEFRSRGFEGEAAFVAYQGMREQLNNIYDRAERYVDPKTKIMELPKVIIELRADGETEYRVVQEIIQVATDSVDPGLSKDVITGQEMYMRTVNRPPNQMKPFVHFNYTTRTPGADG